MSSQRCRRKVVAVAARPVVDALERRTLLASSYVPIAGINDVVYDASRNVVYATTGSGTIQRYDVATGALLPAWTVGGNLLGADVTPDGAFLYVADGANPQIRKVNLLNGTSTALTYSPAFGESNAYDVAVVGTRALFTTQYSGSGWTPLRNIDLATDAITTRTNLGSVRQNSVLSRAADGSGLFLTEANISSGPIHYYTTAEDRFTKSAGTQTFLGGVLHDVSRDGSLVALGLGGVSLYDKSLNGLMTLSGLTGGMRFDPGRDLLYAINPTTDQLIGFDTVAKIQRFAIPLGRNFGGGSVYASGVMAIGANKAFISDDAGLLILDLPQATGEAASFQVSGHYSFSRRGIGGTVRVQAIDPAGYPAVNYRGTITLTSSDSAAALAANYTFDADDDGYVELPVTLNTAGTHVITVRDVSNTALQATLGGRQVHAGNVTLIPVTDRREHVFDPQRDRLYVSTSRGVIERYDLATETLLEPLPVGTSLNAIDISTNNRWLMVQEATSTGSGGQYLKVDLDLLDSGGLASSYLTRILYANYSLESGGWDVARTARGTFAADGMFAGSGWVPVRDVDPVTNATPTMPAFGSVRQNTGIGRSPDGRYLIFTESNISSGPVTIYDTLSNQVVSSVSTNTFLSGESSAVNAGGTLFAVRLGGARIYNRSLQVVTTLSSIDGGMAFDPVSDVFYGVNSATDQLIVYRTSDFSVANTVPLGENVSTSSAMGSGVMSVALDGGQIFLSTPSGVRIFTLDTRALSGNYVVTEGQTLMLSGNAVAAPGRTITGYQWDFDYDGTTFTPDATGQNVNMPTAGFDGPGSRQIALRVTDSGGGSNVATGTVTILNAPPTLTVSAPATIGVGQPLTLILSASDPGPDTITSWTVDWGEGEPQVLGGGSSLSPSRVLNVEGTHTILVSATDEDGTYAATPVQVLVSTPPTIQSIDYTYAAALPAVRVRFSEDVGPSIARGDFEMVQQSSGLGVPLSKMQLTYDSETFTATIRFPGFAGGIIPDGNYLITIFADGVRDGINNPLDGNGDGVAGDDAIAEFFVLAGDANRDRRVDAADRAILSAHLGSGGSFAQADFNYDGIVDATDEAILEGNWRVWLPAQGPLALPATAGNDVYRLRRESPAMLSLFVAGDAQATWRIPVGVISSLSFSGGGGNDTLVVDFSAGNPVPSGGVSFVGGAGDDTFGIIGAASAETVVFAATSATVGATAMNVSAESFTFDGGGGWDHLTVAAGAAPLTFAGAQTLQSMSVATGAEARLPAGGGGAVLIARSLAIAGRLDLHDQSLVLDYDSVSPVGTWNGSAYDGVSGMIASGKIVSGAASGDYTTLGVAEARDVLGLTGTQTATWGGRVVDSSAVLVKFTYGGDANLDGLLNVDDYGQIDFHAGLPISGAGFFNGDFNLDGLINVDDYGILDFNLGIQGLPL